MPTVDKKALGRRVALRRNKLGLSQAAVADAIGMSQQGIYNIEHGSTARPRLLGELAAVLSTSPDWLLWEKGPEVVPVPNSIGQIVEVLTEIDHQRHGFILQYLKTMAEKDTQVA